MSDLKPSAALLRTRLVSRPSYARDRKFENGEGTRPVTQSFLRQAASIAADKVLKQTARRRPTTEEREKEVARRRAWGGGSNMPAHLRAKYTEAERAALSVIAEQCRRKGYCDLCIKEIAKIAGIGRTSVQNAIRKAGSKTMAHISVRERPQQGGVSLTNIIKIICRDWLGWIGRAIGFKRLSTSETGVKNSLSKYAETPKMAFERECIAAFREPIQALPQVEKPSNQWGFVPRWAHGLGGAAHG